jgi:hypothetical protein
MSFRAHPTGAGLNSPYTVQPVIQAQDAFTNPVTSFTGAAVAQITAGGGAVMGGSAAFIDGVATFSGFGISGPPGARTLTFSAPALPALTTVTTPCDPQRTPAAGLAAPSRAFSRYTGAVAFSDTVAIVDRNGSCTPLTGTAASVLFAGAGGWLLPSIAGSPSALVMRLAPGALASGDYAATVSVSSFNGGTAVLPVALTLRRPFTITYGAPGQRVLQLDPQQVLAVPVLVRDTTGAPSTTPTLVVSRAPSIASVSGNGTITALREGQAWAVAQVQGEGNSADSVFVNVTGGTGPVLRTDLAQLEYVRGTTFTIELQLDARGTTIGGAQLVMTWPSTGDPPGTLFIQSVTPGTVGNPQITIDAARGTARVSLASASGMTGLISVARVTLTASLVGPGQLTTRFVELVRPDNSSLLDGATALQYPIVVK